jgi:hypothetical protein
MHELVPWDGPISCGFVEEIRFDRSLACDMKERELEV